MTMQETDLYPPVKALLEGQGYVVKGEARNCDVGAVRGDEPAVVVELKLSINLSVILQAVDRLQLSDSIYVGIPSGTGALKRQRKRIVKLMRMLGLGLLVIDPAAVHGAVEVVCDPGEYKPRQMKRRRERLLGEFQHRVGDPNAGGTPGRRGLLTAYRQKALAIAAYLQAHGATKAAVIAEALTEPKARTILYNNVYGWFERHDRGIYALSPRGAAEFPEWHREDAAPE